LERLLHTQEVDGSSPLVSTKRRILFSKRKGFFFLKPPGLPCRCGRIFYAKRLVEMHGKRKSDFTRFVHSSKVAFFSSPWKRMLCKIRLFMLL
ncbi:MAG: hypothetical protein RR336_08830, partial [Oscillospiraceae bacterium]